MHQPRAPSSILVNVATNERSVDDTITSRDSLAVEVVLPDDPTPDERMAIMEQSGALDFWRDFSENVWSAFT